ncbi:MAG: hypothetical protein QG555_345 [Thermodesulfobacteriota bacterium]|nr:hypothetical protein [Thermodesulfobacteriota bacterium]
MLPQDAVPLRMGTVSFVVDYLHDLHVSFTLSFGIPEGIFKVFLSIKGNSACIPEGLVTAVELSKIR